MMESLEGILKLADSELEAMNKYGKFKSREDVDTVYKLIDIAKDVYCIWMYEEDMEGGESFEGGGGSYARGGNQGGGSYARGGSYRSGGGRERYSRNMGGGREEEYAYARGRGRNARRDSMGRYSREGGNYRYSYGGDKEELMENLQAAMESAPDDQTRQSIQRMIQQMEQQ